MDSDGLVVFGGATPFLLSLGPFALKFSQFCFLLGGQNVVDLGLRAKTDHLHLDLHLRGSGGDGAYGLFIVSAVGSGGLHLFVDGAQLLAIRLRCLERLLLNRLDLLLLSVCQIEPSEGEASATAALRATGAEHLPVKVPA